MPFVEPLGVLNYGTSLPSTPEVRGLPYHNASGFLYLKHCVVVGFQHPSKHDKAC